MTPEPLALLSAFVDGEPVEPEALAAALRTSGAHEALLDFARLRAALVRDDTRPSPTFHARAEKLLAAKEPLGDPTRRPRPLAVAAVLLLAVLLIADLSARLSPARAAQPPRPDRVLHFQPGVDWNATSR
jgi:hypothetical protein